MNRVISLVIFFFQVSCGPFSPELTSHIRVKIRSTGINLPITTSTLLNSLNEQYNLPVSLMAATDAKFVFESFKVPISLINLSRGLGNGTYQTSSPTIYECPETGDTCLVDLMQSPAVDDILVSNSGGKENVYTEETTYEGFSVEFCNETISYNIHLKGTVTINGNRYYTYHPEGLLPGETEQPWEIPLVVYDKCGTTSKLITPITVVPGEDVALTAYIDQAQSAQIDNGGHRGKNCFSTNNPTLCVGAMNVYATKNPDDISIENYRLAIPDRADLLLRLFFENDGTLFGGTLKNIFVNLDESAIFKNSIQISKFNPIGEGNLDLFGMDGQNNDREIIKNFQRNSHEGVLSGYLGGHSYTASRIP